MPPCESMIWVAFMRPRAQGGIARWPATHSSEAAMVQEMPARPATAMKSGVERTTAINTKTTASKTLAKIVRAFGENRARALGITTIAPSTDPIPMLVNNSPRSAEFIRTSLSPMTGNSAGITEMKREKSTLRASTTWIPGA